VGWANWVRAFFSDPNSVVATILGRRGWRYVLPIGDALGCPFAARFCDREAGAHIYRFFDGLVSRALGDDPVRQPIGGLLLVVPIVLLQRRIAMAAWYLAGWLLALTPWIMYSLTTFGVLFVTDVSRVTLSAQPDYLTYFWAQPPLTLYQAPLLWLEKCLANAVGIFNNLRWRIEASPLAIAPFVGALLGLIVTRRIWFQHLVNEQGRDPYIRLAAFSVYWIGLLGSLILAVPADFFSPRYLSPVVWYLAFSASILIGHAFPKWAWNAAVLFSAVSLMLFWQIGSSTSPRFDLALNQSDLAPIEFRKLISCLAPSGGILFIGSDTMATKFSALTGRFTAVEPDNLDLLDAITRALLPKRFDLHYLYVAKPGAERRAEHLFGLHPVEGCTAPVFTFAE